MSSFVYSLVGLIWCLRSIVIWTRRSLLLVDISGATCSYYLWFVNNLVVLYIPGKQWNAEGIIDFLNAAPPDYPFCLVWTNQILSLTTGVLLKRGNKGSTVYSWCFSGTHARTTRVCRGLLQLTAAHVVLCVCAFGGSDNCPCAALHVVPFVYCRSGVTKMHSRICLSQMSTMIFFCEVAKYIASRGRPEAAATFTFLRGLRFCLWFIHDWLSVAA